MWNKWNLIVMKKNIVQIVNFRKNFVFFLMMSYYFFENLKDLHDKNLIVVKKIIKIFAQIFKAFQYLYSRDVTHQNLKSKNILIEFWFFLNIKFADFDFANNKFDLKIVCDIQQYIALEIYSNNEYTISMNLWSIKMIILHYVYELFKTFKQKQKQHKNSSTMLKKQKFA